MYTLILDISIPNQYKLVQLRLHRINDDVEDDVIQMSLRSP